MYQIKSLSAWKYIMGLNTVMEIPAIYIFSMTHSGFLYCCCIRGALDTHCTLSNVHKAVISFQCS